MKVVLFRGRSCLNSFSGLRCCVCPFFCVFFILPCEIETVLRSDSVALEADDRFLTDCKISRIGFL